MYICDISQCSTYKTSIKNNHECNEIEKCANGIDCENFTVNKLHDITFSKKIINFPLSNPRSYVYLRVN